MEKIKPFNIRLSKELWRDLKEESMETEKSMNVIITSLLIKYFTKKKKKELISGDTVIS